MLNIPSTRSGERYFYIFHEYTDLIILAFLLYVLRTRAYIPYYGVINLDTEDNMNNDVELQNMKEAESLIFKIDPYKYE